MIKLIKLIKDFDNRISNLEKAFEGASNQPASNEQSSYKEVIDEWLNGKKN